MLANRSIVVSFVQPSLPHSRRRPSRADRSPTHRFVIISLVCSRVSVTRSSRLLHASQSRGSLRSSHLLAALVSSSPTFFSSFALCGPLTPRASSALLLFPAAARRSCRPRLAALASLFPPLSLLLFLATARRSRLCSHFPRLARFAHSSRKTRHSPDSSPTCPP